MNLPWQLVLPLLALGWLAPTTARASCGDHVVIVPPVGHAALPAPADQSRPAVPQADPMPAPAPGPKPCRLCSGCPGHPALPGTTAPSTGDHWLALTLFSFVPDTNPRGAAPDERLPYPELPPTPLERPPRPR
jgi:hypothetical protein